MNKAYKYRIYPTEIQKKYLDRCMWASRKIWNMMLNKYNEECNKASKTEGYKVSYPSRNNKDYYINIEGTNATISSYVAESLKDALDKFHKHQGGRPKFHKFSYSGSFTIQNVSSSKIAQSIKLMHNELNKKMTIQVNFEDGLLMIPNQEWRKKELHSNKWIKCIFHRTFDKVKCKINSATFSKTSSGKYYVSLQVDDGEKELPKKSITKDKTVGIDVGIKDLAILQDGSRPMQKEWYDFAKSPGNHKKSKEGKIEKHIKKLQRKLARQNETALTDANGHKLYSIGREKTRKKIAKLTEKIANIRKNIQNNLTSQLAKDKDISLISLEDLNIKNMQKNHKLAKSIANCGWYEIGRQLEYKGDMYGTTVLKINPRNTSKMCSNCGFIYKPLDLSMREWICPNCGMHHDRDTNAAINIAAKGYQKYIENNPN